MTLKDGGLNDIWPQLSGNLASLSNERLKQCCQMYPNVDLPGYVSSETPLPEASSYEGSKLRTDVAATFPFLEYASQYVFYHANTAAQDVPQEDFLQKFPIDVWIFLTNVFQYHDEQRHGPNATLLYILAEQNLVPLIDLIPKERQWCRIPRERYGYPILAAFANGCQEALQSFLGNSGAVAVEELTKDPGFGKASELRSGESLLLWAGRTKNWALAECLLDSCHENSVVSMASVMTSPGPDRSRDILSFAAEHGPTVMIERLLDFGAEINTRDDSNVLSPLCEAAICGRDDAVRVLLDKGADVDAKVPNNALCLAVKHRHENTAQMLIHAGADINVKGEQSNGSPLHEAVINGHEEIVRILIDSGADVNAQGAANRGSLLFEAASEGHEKIIQILVDAGADVSEQEAAYYSRPLHQAASKGHEKIVRILIDAGADVNTHDGGAGYNSALYEAASKGLEKIVQMLTNAGADIDALRCLYHREFDNAQGEWKYLTTRKGENIAVVAF